jgi:hypothetical protein
MFERRIYNMEQSSTIRLSLVNDITNIRKHLWETAYSNIDTMNTLANCIYGAFGSSGIVQRIDFKFNDLKFSMDLLRPASNIEMNSILTVAFENFVEDMHLSGRLSDKDYDICKTRANMLFSLILNTETRAEVTL